jgi:hypothetical protein
MLRPGAALAAALVLACALAALSTPGMGDYRTELLPAFSALLGGDVSGFASAAPLYGASAWPRLPFGLLADGLGGSDLAVYRSGAFACLLVLAAVAFALARTMERAGRPVAERAALLVTLLAAPVVLRALRDGHPEDVLAGALAVAAVLLALRARPALAGAALGLAVASKPWAVLAAGPVLLAAENRRLLLAVAAAGVALVAAAPLVLLAGERANGHATTLTQSNWIFHPQQLLWPLGERHANGGVIAPDGLVSLVRPLIVGSGAVLSVAWALRRSRTGAPAHDALLLLALLLLVRCAIDPWNNAYYAVPAVLALGAWEAHARRGLPVLAISVTALTWLSFVRLPMYLGPDALAATYAAWIVPLIGVLGAALYAPGLTSSATAARTSPGSTAAP